MQQRGNCMLFSPAGATSSFSVRNEKRERNRNDKLRFINPRPLAVHSGDENRRQSLDSSDQPRRCQKRQRWRTKVVDEIDSWRGWHLGFFLDLNHGVAYIFFPLIRGCRTLSWWTTKFHSTGSCPSWVFPDLNPFANLSCFAWKIFHLTCNWSMFSCPRCSFHSSFVVFVFVFVFVLSCRINMWPILSCFKLICHVC